MNILFLGNTKDFKTTNDDKTQKRKKNAKVVIIHVLGLGKLYRKISPIRGDMFFFISVIRFFLKMYIYYFLVIRDDYAACPKGGLLMVKKGRTWFPNIDEYRDTITISLDGLEETYPCRQEEKLPNIGAFCKFCATETAKPIHAVTMNGQPAYILQCFRCKNAYPMYERTFKVRYVGYDTPRGDM